MTTMTYADYKLSQQMTPYQWKWRTTLWPRINSILTSPAALRINFRRRGEHFVGSAAFHAVANTLLMTQAGLFDSQNAYFEYQHKIGVAFAPFQSRKEACYEVRDRTLEIPQGNFAYGLAPYERTKIVEEGVKIYYDRLAGQPRGAVGLAAVASMLFHIYETTPTGGTPKPPPLATVVELYGTAFKIAAAIWQTPGAEVPKPYADTWFPG